MKVVFAILFGCIMSLVLPSSASAQQKEKGINLPKEIQLSMDLMQTELEVALYAVDQKGHPELKDSSEKLVALYRRAVNDPKLAEIATGRILWEYSRNRQMADSAVQVSQVVDETTIKFQLLISAQNQLIIEQNAKMITLLQQLASKR